MRSNISPVTDEDTDRHVNATDAAGKPPGGRAALRSHLLALRAAIPMSERAALDERIGRALLAWLAQVGGCRAPAWQRVVALWWPLPGEPDLRPLFGELEGLGWTVVLPAVPARGQPLVFGRWWSGCEMAQGLHRVYEPRPFEPLQPAVLVAPCVGFDARGWRLGYGGGYYDRTLAGLQVPCAGVAYDRCELRLEPQAHDIPFDAILSESRTLIRAT